MAAIQTHVLVARSDVIYWASRWAVVPLAFYSKLDKDDCLLSADIFYVVAALLSVKSCSIRVLESSLLLVGAPGFPPS